MLKELDRVKDELKSMEKKFQKRTVSSNKSRTLFKFVKAKKTILNWYSLKGSLTGPRDCTRQTVNQLTDF